MANYKQYTYTRFWSPEDQEYVVVCTEFPGLSYLDECSEKAWKGMFSMMKEILEDMETNKELIPEPQKPHLEHVA